MKRPERSLAHSGSDSRSTAPAGPARPTLELIPYEQDPLTTLAEQLLADVRSHPPDLRHAIVLLPHAGAIARFRSQLLDAAAARGIEALLAPETATLHGWLQTFGDDRYRHVSGSARELLLLEALIEHPTLAKRWGAWALADSLLALFDELTLNHSLIPADLDTFIQQLSDGYGTRGPPLTPLSEEAHLVYTLWGAWQRQLAADGVHDTTARILHGLARSLEELAAERHIYLAGFVLFNQTELEWIQALANRGQVTLLLHGQTGARGYHPDAALSSIVETLGVQPAVVHSVSAYNQLLNNVYALDGEDLPSRVRQQTITQRVSPARDRLTIHEAGSFEDEARAIDVQVRQWRLQGLRDIGIVTNDRKLARRVRALLERANIVLQDAAGWRLSTTSAATALMRWIECLEQHFAHGPLLELLKSPFVRSDPTTSEHASTALWFEEGLVLRHNIGRGLHNYRRALQREPEALDNRYGAGAAAALLELLERLQLAAHPVLRLNDGRRHVVATFLTALSRSLDTLGMTTPYQQDDAGARVLGVLEEMEAALSGRQLRFTWSEFVAWLRRNLERRRYQPLAEGAGVQLMGFSESRLYRFDGTIIAGALREHLPGHAERPPLFNDSARRHLGLPSLTSHRSALFHDFRRLLESAPRVLVTLRREQEGEIATPSPWVTRLQAFHHIAYADSLEQPTLSSLATSTCTEIVWPECLPLPQPGGHPVATLPHELVPATLSASAHQRILDCPYQYFAAHGLSLAPIEDVREVLEKREYGQRVHLILQAFHIGVSGLPGPFDKPFTNATRNEAMALLADIAQAVFAPDIEHSILARGWLLRWQQVGARYIDWQIARAARWTPCAAELKQRRRYTNDTGTLTLTARIDRLDRGDDGYAILDYKTGQVPDPSAIATGEDIQLAFYALVVEQPVRLVQYVELGANRISDRVKLEGRPLQTLMTQVRERLLHIHQAMQRGAGLPAWGDDATCAYCPMQGLCRKEMWLDRDPVNEPPVVPPDRV
jgi:ATP-dependent helicase/nuclease subunit B